VFIAEDLAGILGAKRTPFGGNFLEVFIPKGITAKLILDVFIPGDLLESSGRRS
jgi:hypothetical protein